MAGAEAPIRSRLAGAGIQTVALVAFCLLILPIIIVAILSFSGAPNMRFPPTQWGFAWYVNAFTRQDFLDGIGYSAAIALAATVIMISGCIPVAYLKVRKGDPAARALAGLTLTPVLVPEVVLGLAALNFFITVGSRNSIANIVILHGILMMPFVYKIIEAGFAQLSRNAEDAARVLGATPVRAFVTVVLPHLSKSLFVAFVFGYVTSFQNFTATLFLIKREVTLPIAIFNYIRTETDPSVAAVSTVITVAIFIAVYCVDRSINLRELGK
jgi:ABC-type spermidine/putrescine transport system permease subunit II